jgi:hypothetical protein
VDQQRCPPIIRGLGAIFVSLGARIVGYALEHYRMEKIRKNYYYPASIYERLESGA